MQKRPLLALTGLRVCLALWVVVFHQVSPDGYLGPWLQFWPSPLYDVLRTGYVAVGLFFVLSGFVLSYNYPLDHAWTRVEWRRFAVARFARIYPAYALGLMVIAPFVLLPLLRHQEPIGPVFGIGLLNWTLLQAWAPPFATTWNGPGWSLSAEAFFYAVFPLVGVFVWRASSRVWWLIWLAALVLPLIALATPLGSVRATDLRVPDPAWAALVTLNPLARLPDFCLGIVMGRVFARSDGRWQDRGWWLAGLAAVGELLILTHAHMLPLVLVSNGLLLPLHGCLIIGLASGRGPLARLLSTRLLVFMGNASYAMYILHVPVGKWFDLLVSRSGISLNGIWILFGYLAVVMGLSAIVLVWIEEPMTRWIKRVLSRRPRAEPCVSSFPSFS
jgi:peptidoglycan/LPS O-acetylase OafA/YrhL